MSTSSRLTPIDEARAGMVLAEAVVDGGAVLLPAGATLSDSTLASLLRRGVEVVHVRIAPEPSADVMEVDPAQQGLRLDRLFRTSMHTGSTDLLRNLIQSYRGGA
jgi:hypothetical protein